MGCSLKIMMMLTIITNALNRYQHSCEWMCEYSVKFYFLVVSSFMMKCNNCEDCEHCYKSIDCEKCCDCHGC